MADRKDSELTIKSTVVAGDLIPLLDSEAAAPEDKNKMVAASTLQGFAGPTEGTWTPAVSSVSVTNSRGYVQINGNMITIIFSFTMPNTASGATFFINNFPITSAVAGTGKPSAYHGTLTKKEGGATSIDNRLELGANSSLGAAVADSAPLGRTLAYFSEADITGFITYVKD